MMPKFSLLYCRLPECDMTNKGYDHNESADPRRCCIACYNSLHRGCKAKVSLVSLQGAVVCLVQAPGMYAYTRCNSLHRGCKAKSIVVFFSFHFT